MLGWVITFTIVYFSLRSKDKKYKVTMASSIAAFVWFGLSMISSLLKASDMTLVSANMLNIDIVLSCFLFIVITIGISWLYDTGKIRKYITVTLLVFCLVACPTIFTAIKYLYGQEIPACSLFELLSNIVITFAAYCILPIIYRFIIAKKPILGLFKALCLCAGWSIIIFFILYSIKFEGITEASAYLLAAIWGAINFLLLNSGKVAVLAVPEIITPHTSNTEAQNSLTEKHLNVGPFTITKQPSRKNKSNLSIVLGIICVLLIGGGVYSFYQNQQLKTELSDANYTYDLLSSRYSEVTKYKGIAKFYLDNAVIVKSGSNLYHRMECPKLGSEYRYRIYNTEAAKGNGFKKCTYCFGMSAEEYADKELGSYSMDTVFDQLYK